MTSAFNAFISDFRKICKSELNNITYETLVGHWNKTSRDTDSEFNLLPNCGSGFPKLYPQKKKLQHGKK